MTRNSHPNHCLWMALLFCGMLVSLQAQPASVEVHRLDTPEGSRSGIADFKISPDGTRVVFRADLNRDDEYGLYSVPLDGSALPVRLNAPPVKGGNVSGYVIDPNGERVVYRADQDTDGAVELYSVPIDGSAAPVQLTERPVERYRIESFAIDPTGERVIYNVGWYSANRGPEELYSVSIDGSAAPVLLNAPTIRLSEVYDFSIDQTGAWVVYRGDQEANGVSELYRVAIDGSVAPVRLNVPLVQGGYVKEFRIGPNGNRVVYRAAQDTKGVVELYSVPLNGSGSPVRLNAPLVIDGDVNSFAIDPAGACVVYRADQDTNNVSELYRVPIDGSAAPVRLNGPLAENRDVGAFSIDSMGAHVVYRADQGTNGVWDLYSVLLDGSGVPVRLNVPRVETGNVEDFAIDPNGARVVYRAAHDTEGVWELYSAPIDGSAAPVRLNAPLDAGDDVANFSIGPNGVRVLYSTGQDHPLKGKLSIVPLDGSTGALPVSDPLAGELGVTRYAFDPAGGQVVFVADLDEAWAVELYTVPVDLETEPVKLSAPLPGAGHVEDYAATADGQTVVYGAADSYPLYKGGIYSAPMDGAKVARRLTDLEPYGSFALTADSQFTVFRTAASLYSLALDGGSPALWLNDIRGCDFKEIITTWDLVDFEVSPDGERVALADHCHYRVEYENGMIIEEGALGDFIVYPVDGSTEGQEIIIGGHVPRNRGGFFSPDGQWLLFLTGGDNVATVESMLADGSGARTALSSYRTVDAAVSADSRSVLYRADEDRLYVYELYSVPIDGSAPAVKVSGPMAVGGDVAGGFVFSPDGTMVGYRADQDTNNVKELYAAPADGSSAPVKLNSPIAAGGGVSSFAFSSDSQWVVYRADQGTVGVFELYGVPADHSAEPVKLNTPPGEGGEVAEDWSLSMNGNGTAMVVYRAAEGTEGVFELYSVPMDGSTPPLKLNGALVEGGQVEKFQFSPDYRWVSYYADQETDDVFELYSVSPWGGVATKRSAEGHESDGPGLWAGDRLLYKDENWGGLYVSTLLGPAAAITLSAEQPDLTNELPVQFEVLFDEAVTGLDAADFVNDGTAEGVVFGLAELAEDWYLLEVVDADGDGTIVPRLPEGAAMGIYDRLNLESTGPDLTVLLDQTPPAITLLGVNPQAVTCRDTFALPEAVAEDSRDGAVAVAVVSNPVDTAAPGAYDVVYEAADSLGNVTQAVLRVKVVDSVPPVVTLLGDTSMRLLCGTVFSDPGATAQDACEGDLLVVVEGQVDVSTAGTYTLTYIAEDGSGNRTTAQRTAEVRCDCLLQGVEVLYPRHGSVVQVTSDGAVLTLQAAVDCPEDTVALQFFLDGAPVGDPFDQPPFVLEVAGIAASAVGVGHVVSVEARDSAGGVLTAQSTFIVKIAADAQENGLPGNDLSALLPEDGDSFFGEGDVAGCARQVGMLAWDAAATGPDEITVELSRPENPDAGVRVSVPRDLLESGEQGILVVLLGCEGVDTALDEGVETIDLLPGALTPGAGFFFVDVLVSADGVTFAGISASRLAASPIQVEVRGLHAKALRETELFVHPSGLLEEPMGAAGLAGTWSAVETAGLRKGTEELAASATALGLFAPFLVDPMGPQIRLHPDAAYDMILGVVPVGRSLDVGVVVENTGTGILEGAVMIGGDPEFELTGATTYRLGPGQRTVAGGIEIRYTPSASLANAATLTFTSTGDGDAARVNATLTVLGTGTESPDDKPFQVFGCGAVGGGRSGGAAWPLAAGFVLALIFLRRRRRRQTSHSGERHHEEKA